ncbi:hypothetical protein BDW60DRAFT_195295 [Aspergillus nidulans var. acristatus]
MDQCSFSPTPVFKSLQNPQPHHTAVENETITSHGRTIEQSTSGSIGRTNDRLCFRSEAT